MLRMISTLGMTALLTTAFNSVVLADDAETLSKANDCRKIDDRMKRLLCFDALFETPLTNAPQSADGQTAASETVAEVRGPIRRLMEAMEQSRAPGETGWIVRVRPWNSDALMEASALDQVAANIRSSTGEQAEGNPVDIFMTMKEADVPADRPHADEAVLLLSCQNDITTLGVLLPKPIRSLQANLSMSGAGGKMFRLNWRDVENGTVVIAGRGLESIDTIKSLSNYQRIQLQVNYKEGSRAFIFDMHDLKDRLKPFRLACHW